MTRWFFLPVLLLATTIAIPWGTAEAQVRVRLPFIDVNTYGGEVSVRAPFVRVYRGAGGTSIRAPFTRVNRPYGYPVEAYPPVYGYPPVSGYPAGPTPPYVSPPTTMPVSPAVANSPRTPPIVRVEFDSRVPVIAPPAARRPPQSGTTPPQAGGTTPVDQVRPRQVPSTPRQATSPYRRSPTPDPLNVPPSRDLPSLGSGSDVPFELPKTPGQDTQPPNTPQPPDPGRGPVIPELPATPENAADGTERTQDTEASGTKNPAEPSNREPASVERSDDRTPGEETATSQPPAHSLLVPLAPGAAVPQIRVGLSYHADTPSGPGRTVYWLTPLPHTEVPTSIEPQPGLNVIAMIHPLTQQSFAVRVRLPEGTPEVTAGPAEVEFDYGTMDIEVKFTQGGGVYVDYD